MINTYISLSDIKRQLGITDALSDVLLNKLLEQSYASINTYLDVDSLDSNIYTENINYDNIMPDGSFYVKNYPVTAISKIDGVTYSGVKDTDWIVDRRRKILLHLLGNYLLANKKFPYFTIEYTAGYLRTATDLIPNDIKMAQGLLVGELYNNRNTSGVSSYSLGDESITFGGNNKLQLPIQVTQILSRYKKGDVI